MATRSVISHENQSVPGSGLRGRYFHWDGYPSGNGVELVKIIRRDGVKDAMKTLLIDNYGWSSLQHDQTGGEDELDTFERDGRFAAIAGYGIAYTTVQGQSHPNDWSHVDDEEFGYVVHDNGDIDVRAYGKHIGTVNAFADDAISAMEHIYNPKTVRASR